jgi:hypothetical protein
MVGGLHHRYIRVAAESPNLANDHKIKEKQLIGTITGTNGKKACVFWKPACQLRDTMSRKTRGPVRSLGPATT